MESVARFNEWLMSVLSTDEHIVYTVWMRREPLREVAELFEYELDEAQRLLAQAMQKVRAAFKRRRDGAR